MKDPIPNYQVRKHFILQYFYISTDTEEFTDRNEASKKTEQKDYLLLYPPVLFVRAVHDSSDLDPERTKIVLNIDSDIEVILPIRVPLCCHSP